MPLEVPAQMNPSTTIKLHRCTRPHVAFLFLVILVRWFAECCAVHCASFVTCLYRIPWTEIRPCKKPVFPGTLKHEAAGWVGYWLRMNSPMQYLPGGTSFRCAGYLLQFPMANPTFSILGLAQGPTSCRCGFAKDFPSANGPKSWVVEPLERPVVLPNQIDRLNSFIYLVPAWPQRLQIWTFIVSALQRETAKTEEIWRGLKEMGD
jgi:hypothetical protein